MPSAPFPAPRAAAAASGPTVAIDIGGTKIAGALVHPDGTMTATTRRPTPRGADADGVMAAVAEVVADLSESPLWASAVRCGIGSAGPVDTSRGTVSPVNIGAWREFPVQERVVAELAARGADLPTVLAGDGVAMTAAEHWLGAARGHANALCMVVSTGVGGGLILNNQLHPGPTGNAGHIGHISVAFDGEPCACGGHGCVESIGSGTAIARWALEQGWRPSSTAGVGAGVTGVKGSGGGPDATAAGVAAAAAEGDPIALAAFDRAGRALAAAIAATATLVETDIAVIGGGVAAAGDTLFAPIRSHLAAYATLSFVKDVQVVPAMLGTHAGLIGAAAAATMLLPSPPSPS
ncbi:MULTISPECIES: ROK family protein [unclassified Streptomyces]|uniref:ROK family protein n=1 Tax=unclassified Streptomyces TaxID=2593676 RepID=UPI002E0DDFDA|nr:ROK family protein [Streptomyces sp. NBC_01207]WTA23282.1 ROK family protein [Streptomyces sp. NBC_00853]